MKLVVKRHCVISHVHVRMLTIVLSLFLSVRLEYICIYVYVYVYVRCRMAPSNAIWYSSNPPTTALTRDTYFVRAGDITDSSVDAVSVEHFPLYDSPSTGR